MKNIGYITVLTVICLISLLPASAQDSIPAVRPKVGLVLSGGGAKGLAHIGALKLIDELGIPVDYVVGTSIGSIVGGLYALGYSAEEMDSLARNQDWSALIRDKQERRSISFRDKKQLSRCFVTIPFLNAGSLHKDAERHRWEKAGEKANILEHLPSAVVDGRNLDQLFTKLSVGYQDSIDFNTLPIPFACVAVDLNTRQEVVFHSGNVADAIRSSMAIPGYFSSVKDNDMFLVDGGIMNNFPVDVAREMGADIIIGLDLHYYETNEKKPVRTIPDEVISLLSIMNGNKYLEGRSGCDILIAPDTRAFGILAFDNKSVEALLEKGYSAAKEVKGELQTVADLMARYPDSNRGRRAKHAIDLDRDSVYINQISVEGMDPNETSWLLSRAGIVPGSTVTGEEMDAVITSLYNTKAFSKVKYCLDGNGDGGYGLKLKFKPEMLHELGLGVRFDSEEMAALLFNVGLNRHKIFGWKFDFDLKLSQNLGVAASYGYTFKSLWQFNADAAFRTSYLDEYLLGERISSSNIKVFRGGVNFENKNFRSTDIKLGGKVERVQYTILSEGEEILPYSAETYLVGYGKYEFDNLDNSYFPTRGLSFDVEGGYYADVFEKKENRECFASATLCFKAVIPFGERVALIPQTYNRWNFGNDIPAEYCNVVGGYQRGRNIDQQMPFVGFNHASVFINNNLDIARMDLRVNIFRKHYITAMANYLTAWDFIPRNSLEDLNQSSNWGFALSYSIDSAIGPVELVGHWSDLSKRFGVYLSIGMYF